MNARWSYFQSDLGGLTREQIVRFLFAVQGHTCLICGNHLARLNATIDHVIPRARGGAHNVWNWALAHKDCNQRKRARMPTKEELARHRRLKRSIRFMLWRMDVMRLLRRVWPWGWR